MNSTGGTDAARRMMPAHQRLDVAARRSPASATFGWYIERELVAVDRLAQIAHQRQALEAVLVVALVPDRRCRRCCASPHTSRRPRCRISVERFERRGRGRGDADARAHVDDVAFERHRRFQRAQQRRGDMRGASPPPLARQQHGELVAAEPRNDVRLRRVTTARSRDADLAQQQVADRMAERVVDVLEMVEIHQQHRRPAARAARRRAPSASSRSVNIARFGQPGQRVAISEVHDARSRATRCLRCIVRNGGSEVADLVAARWSVGSVA